ncbi:MAG: hypothetical protein ACE5EO_00830 [Candidatus Krumholzibacteriia bacterium]
MKKTLLLTVVLMLSATVAFGQAAGVISIFMDPGGLDCNLVDGGLPTNTWNFVHVSTTGATAIQFKATLPACATVTFLSDQTQFPVTVGGSQTGVAIGYGQCLTAPIHVLSIVTFGGGTPACCVYPITGDPSVPSGTIEVVDCGNNLLTGVPSHSGRINDDGSCPCSVPVEETTWGVIKSLYSGTE